ncbi:MAG: helix-turn-helix transcriptional regulator [Bryobacteraceae bacterium]|nr:helix-turn-helix transcriptional regulator [Bryobacteraceae bacterium]
MTNKLQTDFFGHVVGSRRLSYFTVTETTYSPRLEISRHTHEHPYISLPLRGSYSEVCGSSNWHCQEGNAIFHVAGECHLNRFHDGGGHLVNLDISPQLLLRLDESGIPTGNRVLVESSRCRELAWRLHLELRNTDPVSDLATEAIAMELLVQVLRDSASRRTERASDWLKRVHEVINDRFRENLTLSELAAEAGVHPVHLARAFRSRYTCSVGHYIRQLRVDAACAELVNTDTPISAVAMQTGFADQSHLTRTLKQYVGFSPLAFRKACADGQQNASLPASASNAGR